MIKTEHCVTFDLDGTLAHIDEYEGPDVIGDPVSHIIDTIKSLLYLGTHVKILTARVGSTIADSHIARKAIDLWCIKHIGEVLPITSEKDPSMIEMWDDRAIQVIPNTGIPLSNVIADAIDLLRDIRNDKSIDADIQDRIDSFIEEHAHMPHSMRR